MKNILIFLTLLSFRYPYKGSGKIYSEFLRHKCNGKYVFRLSESRVRIFLRARSNDISEAYLIYINSEKENRVKMIEIGSTRGKQYFYVDFEYTEKEIEYYFLVIDGKATYEYMDNKRMFKHVLEEYVVNEDNLSNRVWYQISVDRFRNGYPYNRDKVAIWNSSWSELDKDELKFKKKNKWYTKPYNRIYGGDLQGIIEKLEYLEDLGVEVILLSPIFYAGSVNGHDVLNHMFVSGDISVKSSESEKKKILNGDLDDIVESDKIFKKLAEEVHKRGMKIVVEFPLVTSSEHYAMRDVISKGRDSGYYDWYLYSDNKMVSQDNRGVVFPLNTENSSVKKYLSDSLEKMTKLGLDGIVVNDVKSRDTISFLKNHVNYVANIPFDNEIARSSGVDSSFNFRIFNNIHKLLSHPNIEGSKGFFVSMNLNKLRFPNVPLASLSTIDSERALSSFINSNESNSRHQENSRYKLINPTGYDSNSVKKLKIALTLIATYYGSPLIAYGDEVGQWGASDPDSKKPMIWEDLLPYGQEYDDLDKYDSSMEIDVDQANRRAYYRVTTNSELNRYFKVIFDLRKRYPKIFSNGEIVPIELDFEVGNSVIAYKRRVKGKSIIVVINLRDKRIKFNLPTLSYSAYVDVMDSVRYNSKGYIAAFELEPLGVRILLED